MSYNVSIETPDGYAVVTAQNDAEVQAERAKEKAQALAECHKRGLAVPEEASAHEMYGLVKRDGRGPKTDDSTKLIKRVRAEGKP